MKANWNTWSPFQSSEVRQICAHMTDSEEAEVKRRSESYGVWVAVTLAIPLAFAVVARNVIFTLIAAVLITIHVACIPIWQRMQKRFLCSTVWARERGITADRLRMFGFRE
jgi:hypothetical protein